MNDFTKQELEFLRDGLNYAVGNPNGFTADSIYPLYEKIKSMINNYCEQDCLHEFHSSLDKYPIAKTVCCGDELEYINIKSSTQKCHKCGRILNDNQ